MNRIRHVMILASAGSGKTHALTNRFVRLLAAGAAPERIVALTFTRKAAGEFFDVILTKLAGAAADAGEAQRLAESLSAEATQDSAEEGRRLRQLGTRDFLPMLRRVVEAMHRLRLGTLDGFFARVASNFPFELGLTGPFEILEEHAARMERRRVLRRMFERTNEVDVAQREFIEAFKRATFGGEEKRLGAQLDAFLDEHQEIFLGAPAGDVWGRPERIWRNGARWLEAGGDPVAAANALRGWVTTAQLGERQRQRWIDFLEACSTWSPGVPPPVPLAYVVEKALDAWASLEAGHAVLRFSRQVQELDSVACAALVTLVRHIVAGELTRRMEMTCGIHAVLASYEAFYRDTVRRAGRLTFGDVQRLLVPDEGAPVLSATTGRAAASTGLELWDFASQAEERAERRLLIDYRLDGEIDHWLLDEFQDTSHGQWSILRNLIDEVVQDPSGGRSFFYVGDVKQAIFTWRAGDPRLFREIFEHYNAMSPGAIVEQQLVASWRSGPPIIAAVNAVFGDGEVLSTLFPGEASRWWTREWQKHETARPELGGHVALLHPAPVAERADQEEERFAVAAALLREIQPLERGLTCALLVQKNSTATALAEYLRRVGRWPAVAESDLLVCTDNPLGAALLALAKVAAHPGDTLAWQHVRMTPLAGILAGEGLSAPEHVTRRLLQEIHTDGFERTMVAWARRLEAKLDPDDAFTRERARQFAAAAGQFDATGSRDVAEFIAFMERYTVRDAESASVLRVMTIHKAKGLGFDLVILPDLEGQRIDCRREGLAVQRASDRRVEWVLDLPPKLFYACDEVLAEHVQGAEAEACYEALSLLYVAMTRAKRGMYLITKPPGTSTSRNYAKLLAETLGEHARPLSLGATTLDAAFSEGDPAWYQAHSRSGATAARLEPRRGLRGLDGDRIQRSVRLPARLPSSAKIAEISGAQLFSPQRHESMDFGVSVHALLAEVEWLDGSAARLENSWQQRSLPPAAIAEALACLRAEELSQVWRRREGAEVWRERAFEVVLDGTWLTGVFDRAIVERDATGHVRHATVYDFKTDRADAAADLVQLVSRHAPQLNVYRRVLAVLTGLPVEVIEARLVFTRSRRLMAVPADGSGG